jgi:hypothetical protein
MAQIANNTLVNSGVHIPFSLVARASTGKPPAMIRKLPDTNERA